MGIAGSYCFEQEEIISVSMNQTIHQLLTEQLTSWETARNNYEALSTVKVKELDVNGVL